VEILFLNLPAFQKLEGLKKDWERIAGLAPKKAA
jgi:hypothetical protein